MCFSVCVLSTSVVESSDSANQRKRSMQRETYQSSDNSGMNDEAYAFSDFVPGEVNVFRVYIYMCVGLVGGRLFEGIQNNTEAILFEEDRKLRLGRNASDRGSSTVS